MKIYDLEDRLIDFSVLIINVTNALPKTETGRYLSRQLVRSGISPALHYGEAQSAESRKDFIHKMKIALKELRESYINLKIIQRAGFHSKISGFAQAMEENNQLVSIFVKSIQTARINGQ